MASDNDFWKTASSTRSGCLDEDLFEEKQTSRQRRSVVVGSNHRTATWNFDRSKKHARPGLFGVSVCSTKISHWANVCLNQHAIAQTMQAHNHCSVSSDKRDKLYTYDMKFGMLRKRARMRFHCANALVALRICTLRAVVLNRGARTPRGASMNFQGGREPVPYKDDDHYICQ